MSGRPAIGSRAGRGHRWVADHWAHVEGAARRLASRAGPLGSAARSSSRSEQRAGRFGAPLSFAIVRGKQHGTGETHLPLRANRFGLSVALATPFAEDRSIDLPRLVAHGRQSLADGCTSLTVFGTTGEGASLGQNERQRALGALVGAGIDPATQLVVGIAAASVEDAIAQGRAGLMLGCPSFLLAPPFYFKGAGDEGLFDWFAAVLTGLGPKASNVILYHIPQVTSVGLSIDAGRSAQEGLSRSRSPA